MDAAPVVPAAGAVVAEVPAPGAVTPPAVDTTPPVEVKPDRVFSQSELDEIIKKKDAKRLRERDELRRENEVLRKLALERQAAREAVQDQQPANPQQPAVDGEPKREQYPDMPYEDFLILRAEYRAEKKFDQKWNDREAKDRERHAQTQQNNERETFRKQMKESAAGIEDFDAVLAGIKPTDAVANISASAIEAADAPGKVLYHLVSNPEEAERIAALSVGKQAREIVRLEEKLAKPPVKPSKAPEPIKPVVGGKSAVGDEMPNPQTHQKEWMEWRQRQVRAATKGARA